MSCLFEGIFVDAKGVNCASLEIVCKKIFDSIFFEALANRSYRNYSVSEFILLPFCKQNAI